MKFLCGLEKMHALSLLVLRWGLALSCVILVGILLPLVTFDGWTLQTSGLYDSMRFLTGGAIAVFALSLFGSLIVEDILRKTVHK